MKGFMIAITLLLSSSIIWAVPFTYTASPGHADGTYGNTDIPVFYYDETGQQLFDGQYGTIGWMKDYPVESVVDYWNRYDEEKGYGYPWVGWREGAPTILFDLGEETIVNQIGLHYAYVWPAGANPPLQMTVDFSNNGNDFANTVTGIPESGLYNNSTYWLNLSGFSTEARYARINLQRDAWLLVDEVSINDRDGSPVPEAGSFTLFALGGLLILLRRNKR